MMVQPGCSFLSGKGKLHQQKELTISENGEIEEILSVASSMKASLLKPPRQLPFENPVQETCDEDADIVSEYNPMHQDCQQGSSDEECPVVLGLRGNRRQSNLDPSVVQLKSSIASLLEELSVLDAVLHPRKTSKLSALSSEIQVHPEYSEKVAGQIDTLNFMMSWLATEKRTLEWQFALMGEKVRNLEREVREIEHKMVCTMDEENDRIIIEELWAEFLSVSKELQQVQARVKVERKINKRVEKYVRRLKRSLNISAAIAEEMVTRQPQMKDPTSFFAETDSLDFAESVFSESKSCLSAVSRTGTLPASNSVQTEEHLATQESLRSFDFFGSDFVPDRFSQIIDRKEIDGEDETLMRPVKCFSSNSSNFRVFEHLSSLNNALVRLGSKAEGIGSWMKRSSVIGQRDSRHIPHEELSDDDSDFESEFAAAVVEKSVLRNGRVRIKASNLGRVDRNINEDDCYGNEMQSVQGTSVFGGGFLSMEIEKLSNEHILVQAPQGIGRGRSVEASEIESLTMGKDSDVYLGSGLDGRRTQSEDLAQKMNGEVHLQRYARSLGYSEANVFFSTNGSDSPMSKKSGGTFSSTSSFSRKNGIGKSRLMNEQEAVSEQRIVFAKDDDAPESIDLFEWNRKQSWYNALFNEEAQ